MQVVKKVKAIINNPVTYRISRVDGQAIKPGWSYEWIKPVAIDADFMSNNIGSPTVIVRWNELTAPNTFFTLLCEVTTDVEGPSGPTCISTVAINVQVDDENTSLTCELSGEDICIYPGTEVDFTATCSGSDGILFDSNYAKFKNASDEWVSGPFYKVVSGDTSTVTVKSDLHSFNVNAQGTTSSGSYSAKVYSYKDMLSAIIASITADTEMHINDTSLDLICKASNLNEYAGTWNASYRIYIGKLNGDAIAGSTDENDYHGTNWKVGGTSILLLSSQLISSLTKPEHPVTYTFTPESGELNYRFLLYVRIYDPATSCETYVWTDGHNLTIEACPTEIELGDITVNIPGCPTDIELGNIEANVPGCPTEIELGDITATNVFIPEFEELPCWSRSSKYIPEFELTPCWKDYSTGFAEFEELPCWSRSSKYTPGFATLPCYQVSRKDDPEFATLPCYQVSLKPYPTFVVEPCWSRSSKSVPVFITLPCYEKSIKDDPTFAASPCYSVSHKDDPGFNTLPCWSRSSKYIPTFDATPCYSVSRKDDPTFQTTPCYETGLKPNPEFETKPCYSRSSKYDPSFITMPCYQISRKDDPTFQVTPCYTYTTYGEPA